MNLDAVIGALLELADKRDEAGCISLLERHPELLSHRYAFGTLIHWLAGEDLGQVIDYALQKGIPVDLLDNDDTALIAACDRGAKHAAKALIQHGANVNYGIGESATPIFGAVHENSFDLAQLLINHGADVNASYQRKSGETVNPLSFAEEYEFHEIASLLRQHGAVLPDRTADPPKERTFRDEILEHFAQHIAPSDKLGMHEMVPLGAVLIWVRKIPDSPGHPYRTLFTVGVSDLPLPSGETVELMLKLPPGWKIDRETERDPQVTAPLYWMRLCGHALHDQGAPLGDALALPAPRLIPENWPFAGFLFTPSQLPPIQLSDGRAVTIYAVQPIHASELKFAEDYSAAELAQRLIAAGVNDIYRPDRRPVV